MMSSKFDPETGRWEIVKERDDITLQNSDTQNFQTLQEFPKAVENVISTADLIKSVPYTLAQSHFSSSVVMLAFKPLAVFTPDQNLHGGIIYSFSFAHFTTAAASPMGVCSKTPPIAADNDGAFIGCDMMTTVTGGMALCGKLTNPIKFPPNVGLWFFIDVNTQGGAKHCSYSLF